MALGLIYVKFLSVWFFVSQLILSQFRFPMDKGSLIWEIKETNLNGRIRTRMDASSIILVI